MRIDIALVNNGLCRSRSQASRLIAEGRVTLDGVIVTKPSLEYNGGILYAVADRFVSRAGDKLDAALTQFEIDVTGLVAVDIGASTGGFTDCLLSRGAVKVYAVDVGTLQLDGKLRNDKRVVVMENTNARALKYSDFPEKPEIAVMDVSFISQTLLFDALADVLSDGAILVSLVKPQFEVGKGQVGKGGIVKDEKHRLSALENVKSEAAKRGFDALGTMVSPITGGDGNTEYLVCFMLKGV